MYEVLTLASYDVQWYADIDVPIVSPLKTSVFQWSVAPCKCKLIRELQHQKNQKRGLLHETGGVHTQTGHSNVAG